MAKITIRAWEPSTITIDGHPLNIRVKRLSVEEKALFDRLFYRYAFRQSERLLNVRRPGEESEHVTSSALSSERLAEESAWLASKAQSCISETDAAAALASFVEHGTVPDGLARAVADEASRLDVLERYRALVKDLQPTDRFLIPEDEIRRRRLIEMTPADVARYEQLKRDDLEAGAIFFREAFGQFIRVPEGQIEVELEDGGRVVPVTTGEQLANYFGGRDGKATDVIPQLARAIREENEMSSDEKNASRSRFGSEPGSTGRDRTPAGVTPATTAGSAETPATATSGAAMPLDGTLSGPMASSPSSPAPS